MELPPSFSPLEQPVGMLNIPQAWEEFGWGRVVGALRSSASLPQHELTLVFVMSAGEGHHVVFHTPSLSFLPQSKFVLFDLNAFPWLGTRESGAVRKGTGQEQDGAGGLGQAGFWYFFFLHCELPHTWLVFNFHGFRIEAIRSSGYALGPQDP